MAKTAEDKVKQDLKNLPVDVPPPKPMEPLSSAEMGAALGDLELRAELDPLLMVNPIARLGWDVLTRGEIPGEGPSGEILALVASSDGGVDPRSGDFFEMPGYNLLGFLGPSDTYDPDDRASSIQDLLNSSSGGREIGKNIERQTGRGIEDLLPASEGSTVFYTTGRYGDGVIQPKSGLMTLMHELAHVGMRELKKQGVGPDLNLRSEEMTMDEAELLAANETGFPLMSETREKAERFSYAEEYLRDANKNAVNVLAQRGIAPQATQDQSGISSLLGFKN